MKIGYRAHIVQPKFEQQGGAEISSIRTAKQATPGPHQRNRGDTPIIFHRRIARTIVWSKPIFDIRTLQADFVSSAHLIFFFFNPSISLFSKIAFRAIDGEPHGSHAFGLFTLFPTPPSAQLRLDQHFQRRLSTSPSDFGFVSTSFLPSRWLVHILAGGEHSSILSRKSWQASRLGFYSQQDGQNEYETGEETVAKEMLFFFYFFKDWTSFFLSADPPPPPNGGVFHSEAMPSRSWQSPAS